MKIKRIYKLTWENDERNCFVFNACLLNFWLVFAFFALFFVWIESNLKLQFLGQNTRAQPQDDHLNLDDQNQDIKIEALVNLFGELDREFTKRKHKTKNREKNGRKKW